MGKHSGEPDSRELENVKQRLVKFQQELNTVESYYSQIKNSHPALAARAKERIKDLKKDISEAISELEILTKTNRTFKLW